MDSPCIKQTVCKVFKIFQCGKYLVAYVLKVLFVVLSFTFLTWDHNYNISLASFLVRYENSTDSDKRPQNVVSDQGLHC